MTTEMLLARYSTISGALVSGFVIAELHHLLGHDLFDLVQRSRNPHRHLVGSGQQGLSAMCA